VSISYGTYVVIQSIKRPQHGLLFSWKECI